MPLLPGEMIVNSDPKSWGFHASTVPINVREISWPPMKCMFVSGSDDLLHDDFKNMHFADIYML